MLLNCRKRNFKNRLPLNKNCVWFIILGFLTSPWAHDPMFIVKPRCAEFFKMKRDQKRVERGTAVSLLFCCLLWARSCFLNEFLNVNIHVERLKNFQVTHGKCWISEIISMYVCLLADHLNVYHWLLWGLCVP